jgi:hypothetical protein
MIGGAAMSMPAIAAGVGIGGAMVGGAAGWLDPFTGVARAANAGSGAGMGAGWGGLSHIGRTFAQGGMRAGLGALGGGAMAAGAMALPYMAVGAGIQGAAESIYEGAQTYGDAGRIGQSFGPAYGQSGALPGGKLPRHQIRQIATVLEEFADENIIASVTTATRLAQKFTQMGMMSGVQDAASFKQKFSSLAKQVDTVAKVMGTSLEEAAPVLQSMQRMGLWRPEDVMGTLMTSKMVGPQAAQQMMGAMQTGAQQSHALGGSLAGGAALGREAFMTVQGGLRTGTFSNESIAEYTGGVGGVEGQRMMAQSMTSAMQRAGRHPLYQAMMAGLGEMQEGKFTGRIDEERLQEFMGGGINAQELMRQGRQRTRGRKAQLSFDYRRDQLSQEMVSKGGVGGMAAGLESIMSQRPDWEELGDEAKGRLIQMISGSDQRTAEMIRRVMEDHQEIQGDHQRRAMAAVEDYYQQRERRAHHSIQGVKDALKQKSEQAWRPLREFGADLGQAYDETRDAAVRGIFGVDRGVSVSAGQARTLAMRGQVSYDRPSAFGDVTEIGGMDLGITGLMNYGTTNRGEILRRGMARDQLQDIGGSDIEGVVGAAARGGMAGAAAGGAFGGITGMWGAAVGGASRYLTGGAGEINEAGVVTIGRDETGQRVGADLATLESAQRRIAARARSGDAYTLGFQGEDDSKNLKRVKAAMRNLTATTEGRNALRKINKEGGGSAAQTEKIMQLLGGDPETKQAIDELVKSKNTGSRGQDEMDIMRAVSEEVSLPPGQDINWSENEDAIQWANLDSAAFAEAEGEIADRAAAGLRESTGLTGVGRKFATSIAAGTAAGGLLGTFAGVGVGAFRALVGDNVSEEEFRSLVTDPDVSADLVGYLRGDKDASLRLQKKAESNDTIRKMMDIYDKDPDAKKAALEATKEMGGLLSYKAGERTAGERAEAARQALGGMDKVRMNAADKGEFSSILKDIAEGKGSAQEGAIARLGELGQRMKSQGRGRQLEGAGSFGQLALGMAEISGISEAKDAAGFEKIRKKLSKRFGGDIFAQQEEEIQAMIASGGGLSAEELQKLEETGSQIGKQLSVRAAKGGKGGPMGELMGQLSTYTAANQKFVHTVAASISGIETGDLKAAADKLSEIMGQEGGKTAPKQD